MNVEIRSEAHWDIADGVAFYDRQGLGAGDYFYQRIFEDIDSLSETAGVHEKHFGYYRKIASRHPFLIYYQFIKTGVEVIAVLDGRSHPNDIDALLRRR
jgi:plasmid stabilization system protein ParE